MPFFVYILRSKSKDRYYIGQSDNMESRMEFHNTGKSRYTSIANDWSIVYTEEYATRREARKRENEIKRKKSRIYVEWLVSASSRQKSG